MRRSNLLITVCASTAASLAVPLLDPQGTTARAIVSCPTEPLTPSTWTSLNLDTFLSNWVAANVTATSTNNIQALAASFGAPNFEW